MSAEKGFRVWCEYYCRSVCMETVLVLIKSVHSENKIQFVCLELYYYNEN